MWRDGRMVALTFVIAALYSAGLILSSEFVLIEQFTTIRPANVFPVVFSLLFGPAAAWGAAFGNLFADIFSRTLTWGSVFGFVGNFFAGYVGYVLWGNLPWLSSGSPPTMRSGRQLVEFWVIALAAAVLTAAIIAWGLEFLGLFPFAVFASIIAVNNFLAAAVLGPPLLYVLYPFARDDHFLYTDLLDATKLPDVPSARRRMAAIGLVAVSLTWFLLGMGLSVLVLGVPLGTAPGDPVPPAAVGSAPQVALGTIAFALVLVLVGLSGDWLSSQSRPVRTAPNPPGGEDRNE